MIELEEQTDQPPDQSTEDPPRKRDTSPLSLVISSPVQGSSAVDPTSIHSKQDFSEDSVFVLLPQSSINPFLPTAPRGNAEQKLGTKAEL